MLLREKGLPQRFAAMAPGGSKQPAYLALHPFGRLPHLTHGAFALYETQAILRYIDRIAPAPALVPADPRAEARMNQIIGILDWYLFPWAGAGIAFHRVVCRRFGWPADEAAVAENLPKAARALAALATLQDRAPFLAGEAMSLADIHVAPHLDMLADCAEGEALPAPHEGLRRWLAAMRARPSKVTTGWDALLAAA